MKNKKTTQVWNIYTYTDDTESRPCRIDRFYSEQEARDELTFYEQTYPHKQYWIEEDTINITGHALPTPRQVKKLCSLQHDAFVEIRGLLGSKRHKQAYDLADLFHNLPNEMFDPSCWNWDYLEGDLIWYQQKYDIFFRDHVDTLRDIRKHP